MSTTSSGTRRKSTSPLIEGEQLDQLEFHERYLAMPPDARAELIGGVVRIPGPLDVDHGVTHVPVIVWLASYAESTPGVEALSSVTTILGPKSELEPDALLRVLPEHGGHSTVERGFLRGAPELVVEVAKTTRFIDLGPKLADYERNGVIEYLVRALEPDEVIWFRQRGTVLERVGVDSDGFFRSFAFPGLWLQPAALLSGDTRQLREVVDVGVATAEHARFAKRLGTARAGHWHFNI